MRMVSVSNLQPGMVTSKPIHTEDGKMLIGVGISLSQKMITHLFRRNVSIIYIEDYATRDLDIKDSIPFEVRLKTNQTIQKTFQDLQKSTKQFDKNLNNLTDIFKVIIKEITSTKNAMNLLTNVFIHDNYTFAHSTNVTIYTLAMAKTLGFNDKKLTEIGIGGMLHDVGKVMIPNEVLNKKGKLTPEEYEIIKKHPADGFEFLRKHPDISLLSAHCAYQHHEKLDGTGYPRGLKKDEIHPYGKIMAIADVFDALTSHRSYRDALLPHTALEILFAGANTHFDSELIRVFQKSVATYPEGSTVELNTGEKGVVISYQFDTPARPVVRIIHEPNGKRLDKPYDIDLSKQLSLMITSCDAIMS